jgi:hypothetical protein
MGVTPPAGLLVTGTFGKLGVDCPHMSLDWHVRRGTRDNQAEACLQVTLAALEPGRGKPRYIVAADHVISSKQ